MIAMRSAAVLGERLHPAVMSPHFRARDTETPAPPTALAARLAAGEADALEILLDQHWTSIARFAARALGDLDAAHDVCQEVFIRVWQEREDMGRAPELLRAYLYRTARNLVIDELRKRTVRSHATGLEYHRYHGRLPDPDERLAAAEVGDAIAAALDALPPRRRDAFVLAYLHGLSYNEVAHIMGTSPATVKNQIAAALAHLRTALAPQRNS